MKIRGAPTIELITPAAMDEQLSAAEKSGWVLARMVTPRVGGTVYLLQKQGRGPFGRWRRNQFRILIAGSAKA